MDRDVEHCIEMIDREEQRAAAALSSEAAEMHHQMVMLYRAQLQHLEQAKRARQRNQIRSAPVTSS